jgi:ribosome biogenesis protein Nip4
LWNRGGRESEQPIEELESAEKKEIERILKSLSEQVAKVRYLLNNERILIFLMSCLPRRVRHVSNHTKPELTKLGRFTCEKPFIRLFRKRLWWHRISQSEKAILRL